MTEELYGRLTDRLRHVIQFSEASRQAAEEALALLEAAKEKAGVDARDTHMGERLAQPADAPDEQLGDGTGELEPARDVDAVVYLLAVHKLVEYQASGSARYLAQAEAMAIIAALNRVAPAVLGDALALYEKQSEPIREVFEASPAREGAENA
jgi:hypothetical protein